MAIANKSDVAIYPEHLLDGGVIGDREEVESSRRWRVLYTKSRHEKAVARQLAAREIPFYLPLITRTTVSRGRKLRSLVPLFSNYLFMFGDDEERLEAWTTNCLSRILDVDFPGELRRDLLNLSLAIVSKVPLTKEERLGPGERVRVKSGQLQGLEGTIVERQGNRRLVVAVNFLQQGASMVLDDFQVEPL